MTNSPPYLEKRKKDVFAMIRQLGIPTFFISLSAADTKWEGLLRALVKQHLDRDVTDEEIHQMSWQEKSDLLRKDPVMCARFFDNRTAEFITNVLKNDCEPIGPLSDYFYRVEFQQRGSPHIHALVWVQDVPTYECNSEKDIVDFIDTYISCSADVEDGLEDMVAFQSHKHSKTCRKNGRPTCRFNFPIPPMRETRVLQDMEEKTESEKGVSEVVYQYHGTDGKDREGVS